jgi:GntR family transcriptional regulator/MocR family aminotransferase
VPPALRDRPAPRAAAWEARLKLRPAAQRNIVKPANWQDLPFPFIYGQFDASLFPLAQWRECAMESMHVSAVRSWAPDHIDRDHEPLLDEIQQRLLPARGIWARREEILVTAGAQQATFLLAQLLVGPRTAVGVEDPGYPDARNNFLLRSATVVPLPVDGEGLVVDARLARCRYVYVTPSHQCPTTVTMPVARREKLLAHCDQHDIVVIEDDHESELNFRNQPSPALKSLDTNGRVIYLGSLSKTLAHGLRIGYVVAPARLIDELRALRRLMVRHPPTNNEHTAARFIKHGFHESFVRKLNLAYRQRADLMKAALTRELPAARWSEAAGGSALWVRLPRGADTRLLARRALAEGIVIEPGDVFFHREGSRAQMRLGYSSIPPDRIGPGIARLARLVATAGS